mgnify:FL=1
MFKILSTGSALPALSKTNDDLSTFLDTSDEWISQRTGIRQRSLCSDETLTDLLTVAAKQALERAGVEPQQLDLILCATIRGEYITPSQACVIQQKLGAGCPAMDISAACTGFVYALDVAAGYFARKKVKKVLVLAGDTMSRLVDWSDRGTCILFGDGAGAIVLTAEEQETKACEKIHSDGEKGVSLTCEKGTYLQMDGRAVFQFALSRVPEVIREVLKEAEVPVEEIDAFILHQANSRIIDGVAKRLKAPKEKFPRNIEAYGNTCAASIPILLDEWNRSGRAKKGQRIVLSGFGAGLIWGAAYLEW